MRAGLAAVVCSLVGLGAAQAYGSIAIVKGSFYTTNLRDDLIAQGETVTEIASYNAASLATFDAVILYGNSYTDMSALEAYVTGGGTLIETPWFWYNYSPPTSLQVLSNGGTSIAFSESYPGVSVVDAGNSLLSGVSFPAGPGGFNIGRTLGNTFVPGANAVANWADGTAFIGTKSLGSGTIVAINLHVVTSDTAYEVIDQPWATQLFANAANINEPIPEPSTCLTLSGLIFCFGLAGWRRRKVAPDRYQKKGALCSKTTFSRCIGR